MEFLFRLKNVYKLNHMKRLTYFIKTKQNRNLSFIVVLMALRKLGFFSEKNLIGTGII